MVSLSENWYINVANVYEAYSLFFDRNPDFCVKYWKDQERIKVEFQTMTYLIEYGLEIVLGDGKYPTYQFNDSLYNSTLESKTLKETIDFILSAKNPDEYIRKDMCTLDEQKKQLIKRYGRLFCIKVGNPSSIETLSWMLNHYHTVHTDAGISEYSIMREEECYKSKGTLQTILESTNFEQYVFSHSSYMPDISSKYFLNEYFIETNGFVGDKDRDTMSYYEYLKKANCYRNNAIGLADPFIHYVKNTPAFDVNWDEARKQLTEEGKKHRLKKL